MARVVLADLDIPPGMTHEEVGLSAIRNHAGKSRDPTDEIYLYNFTMTTSDHAIDRIIQYFFTYVDPTYCCAKMSFYGAMASLNMKKSHVKSALSCAHYHGAGKDKNSEVIGKKVIANTIKEDRILALPTTSEAVMNDCEMFLMSMNEKYSVDALGEHMSPGDIVKAYSTGLVTIGNFVAKVTDDDAYTPIDEEDCNSPTEIKFKLASVEGKLRNALLDAGLQSHKMPDPIIQDCIGIANYKQLMKERQKRENVNFDFEMTLKKMWATLR